MYILAAQLCLQLTISQFPRTLLPTVVGLHTGYLYRVQIFCETWVKPWLSDGALVRRTNRVLPEARQRQRTETPQINEEEVVTTARRPSRTDPAERLRRQREFAQRQTDIQTLTGMFPNVRQSVVRDVLQRSPNVEAAAALLLSSQENY
ncbi:uncharacterized protein B0H18DRAFT_3266 [Fomitopsis serialis]|uniref:uncharacterized protein n=1 Tax=Fomitopsis serialis TaxID=139415 RepID=UPI002007CCD3|nr:uncharacterized protein B0H18DRAFT_3266 [Neoantrodia serialis]KAH9938103.1 hypothetical protein B0H18DRAFT_3266 [Neoantrodia serialis]